jgi:hypothetical protein
MTTTEPQCPKCSGPLWDNRQTKRNPKQPDFKCKDKACNGVIWPPKDQAQASQAPQPHGYSAGPHIPALDGPYQETGAPPVVAAIVPALAKVFALYDRCLAHAILAATTLEAAEIGSSPESVTAACATLFIQACQKGLAA